MNYLLHVGDVYPLAITASIEDKEYKLPANAHDPSWEFETRIII